MWIYHLSLYWCILTLPVRGITQSTYHYHLIINSSALPVVNARWRQLSIVRCSDKLWDYRRLQRIRERLSTSNKDSTDAVPLTTYSHHGILKRFGLETKYIYIVNLVQCSRFPILAEAAKEFTAMNRWINVLFFKELIRDDNNTSERSPFFQLE